jgi:hypothetical protein
MSHLIIVEVPSGNRILKIVEETPQPIREEERITTQTIHVKLQLRKDDKTFTPTSPHIHTIELVTEKNERGEIIKHIQHIRGKITSDTFLPFIKFQSESDIDALPDEDFIGKAIPDYVGNRQRNIAIKVSDKTQHIDRRIIPNVLEHEGLDYALLSIDPSFILDRIIAIPFMAIRIFERHCFFYYYTPNNESYDEENLKLQISTRLFMLIATGLVDENLSRNISFYCTSRNEIRTFADNYHIDDDTISTALLTESSNHLGVIHPTAELIATQLKRALRENDLTPDPYAHYTFLLFKNENRCAPATPYSIGHKTESNPADRSEKDKTSIRCALLDENMMQCFNNTIAYHSNPFERTSKGKSLPETQHYSKRIYKIAQEKRTLLCSYRYIAIPNDHFFDWLQPLDAVEVEGREKPFLASAWQIVGEKSLQIEKSVEFDISSIIHRAKAFKDSYQSYLRVISTEELQHMSHISGPIIQFGGKAREATRKIKRTKKRKRKIQRKKHLYIH